MPIRQSPGHTAVRSKSENRRIPERKPFDDRKSPSLQEYPSQNGAQEPLGHSWHSRDGAMCSDRAELIERIKRGESPTWVPSQTLQQEYLKENREAINSSSTRIQEVHALFTPPLDIEPTSEEQDNPSLSKIHSPFEIERPPLALHSGDFHHDLDSINPQNDPTYLPGNTKPSATDAPWSPSSPLFRPQDVDPFFETEKHHRESPRARAPSLNSFSSSSYVLKKPTTPLVQQSNNTDLDLSDRDRSSSPEKRRFRHSLYPCALRNLHSEFPEQSASLAFSSLAPTHRREASFPSAHQPRRAATSSWVLQPSSPPTQAFLRSRRTSFSSEASSRRRASMVGSYEESILRGRMSTAPSKPFDFYAHIGVLGRGKRPIMPPHVVVPFQAVFYDWSLTSDKTTVNDEPSPYVGNIEFQNNRLAQGSSVSSERVKSPPTFSPSVGFAGSAAMDVNRPGQSHLLANRKRKRTDSLRPPAGSYRIPQQGQIQVVVKNPYKTALKLFLVPYDLTGMQPSQKTFVRQRYYSSGPIIERPIPSSPGLLPAASANHNKPILRYLIHLNICCSAKNHYYLYQHIRVVFANRVPDDQERLTKDIQEPKPKYSGWKPLADPLPSQMSSSLGPADMTPSRVAHEYSPASRDFDLRGFNAFSASPHLSVGRHAPPMETEPFRLTPLRGTDSRGDNMDADSSRPLSASEMSSIYNDEIVQKDGCLSSDSGDSDSYTKLRREDFGYGGLLGRASTPDRGEGLLARRLRGLDVQRSADTLNVE